MSMKIKGISRVAQESKNTYGWYVRITFQGRMHSKFFSDKKNGGNESALQAATAWRNQKEKEIGKPRTDQMMFSKSRGGTGVIGVLLNEKRERYEATWVTPEGKRGKTSVSIKKHGKKNAFNRACLIRQEKEALRLGL
ncbi:AP2/ERF family transcription factor [Desulfotalea psychrophila]|uniref:AP2/ERF domain-containing protein n=1 Tax=Desulfotalea psychrophila (strain LSv54 / DSM 12343) TaxID=177439 RepID=Q6ALM4_DESPS|nr:AP2/ERF family transcription factor [Desulfotalea psychrophila]CAG36751.1 hypothetical protein DP2022 [Desulfotalea psychrophila LSv54]